MNKEQKDYLLDKISRLNKLNKELRKENKRLNAALDMLERFFHNREDYEWAELVRQCKEANIEWLEKKENK